MRELAQSPARIWFESREQGLGRGRLGAVLARAGVGKTACLIHFGLQHLVDGRKVVHVSLKEGPEKVAAYYGIVAVELFKGMAPDEQRRLQEVAERNRMILAYLNQSFEVARLQANLVNLKDHLQFTPDILLVDGLEFENARRDFLEELQKLVQVWGLEAWFTVLSHRHIIRENARGIPYPLDECDDLFDLILQLSSESSGIYLRFLKDRTAPPPPVALRLDPNSYLVTGGT